ncbi:MAG: nucleotidyltransferase family protein [Clostridiales bacterium]|nr:nucleotidyltransferase family protein [Clostridiales bacterium]
MKTFGIVCEYNPFHSGHLYHINESRRLGAEAVVCVMSGNFVQRADFAMTDMHSRAESAVRNGADLVIQLPTPWVLSSAEKFAFGAVYILNALGVVTHLSYGAENPETDMHIKAARLLMSADFPLKLTDRLKTGVSFASARYSALAEIDSAAAEVLRNPNNILAVEYIKALTQLGSDIIPVAVERRGSMHDEMTTENEHISATAIRKLLLSGDFEEVSGFLPRETCNILLREIKNKNAPVWIKDADKAMLSCLKKLSAEDYLRFNDVSEGLEKRLYRAVSRAVSLDEAVMLAKTKRYTHSRIRRIYLSAFLGATKDLSSGAPGFARILAFNDTGRKLIAKIRKKSEIPVITKPAAVKKTSADALRLFEFESRATDLYSLFKPEPSVGGSEWLKKPVYTEM